MLVVFNANKLEGEQQKGTILSGSAKPTTVKAEYKGL